MSKNYSEMNLPELYAEAYARGAKTFFGKTEEEMAKFLSEWDDEHSNDEDDEVDSKGKTFNKKSFRAAAERLLDDDFEEDDFEEDDFEEDAEESVSEKVSKKLKIPVKAKSGRTDEAEDTEYIEDDTDEFLDDLYEDEEEVSKPKPNKEKKMAAKKTAKETVSKKTSKTSKKEAPAKKPAVKRGEITDKAPYVVGTAGYCAFIALKKGGKMEQVVANTDKLIAKYGAKPPAKTEAKVKIILTEINKGKKGTDWGSFTINEKTKRISHVPE